MTRILMWWRDAKTMRGKYTKVGVPLKDSYGREYAEVELDRELNPHRNNEHIKRFELEGLGHPYNR